MIISCTGCAFKSTNHNVINDEKAYLNNNNTMIDLANSSNFSSFRMIDNYLSSKEIFLSGESHSVKINTSLELEFLKYFSQKAGVKYYLIEYGNSLAMIYNKYLQTGDDSYLKIAFDSLEGSLTWTKEEYEKWKNIYKYNLALPQDKKIMIIGVDM
jgi:hypothetical protein